MSLATLSFSNLAEFYPGISEELWSFSGCMGDSAAKIHSSEVFLCFWWFCLGKGIAGILFFFWGGGDPKLMQMCGEFDGFPMDLRLVIREP